VPAGDGGLKVPLLGRQVDPCQEERAQVGDRARPAVDAGRPHPLLDQVAEHRQAAVNAEDVRVGAGAAHGGEHRPIPAQQGQVGLGIAPVGDQQPHVRVPSNLARRPAMVGLQHRVEQGYGDIVAVRGRPLGRRVRTQL
jgi:hypothetical protein